MISDGIPRETLDADPTLVGPYFLWRLLIDERHQRRGYGTATLDAVVAYVRGRPGGDALLTSAGQGEGSPQPFYERYGFVPTDGPRRVVSTRPEGRSPASGSAARQLPGEPRRSSSAQPRNATSRGDVARPAGSTAVRRSGAKVARALLGSAPTQPATVPSTAGRPEEPPVTNPRRSRR